MSEKEEQAEFELKWEGEKDNRKKIIAEALGEMLAAMKEDPVKGFIISIVGENAVYNTTISYPRFYLINLLLNEL